MTKSLKVSQERVRKELGEFVSLFKRELGRAERRKWCEYYLWGLMLEGERKSIEPLASRLSGGNVQALQQFVNQSPWGHEEVQKRLCEILSQRHFLKNGSLILDDTSLPKKGKYSVGVSRQYCKALKKVSNCQSLVSWYFSNEELDFPIRMELYLPDEWIQDRDRMVQAGVPEKRWKMLQKWELGLKLLEQIREEGLLKWDCILCDGDDEELDKFLNCLDEWGEKYLAKITMGHFYWPLDISLERAQNHRKRPKKYKGGTDKHRRPLRVEQWARALEEGKQFRRIRLNHFKEPLETEIAAIRVLQANSKLYWKPGKEVWLVMEKQRSGYKYWVSNLSSKTALKEFADKIHHRWKIEQGHPQMKEELGLDHFEGRSWRGLHHHVSLVMMAYAFLLLRKQGIKRELLI